MDDARTLAHLRGRQNHLTTTVDVLRHGALEGGVRYRGCTEAALTRAGRAAMDAVWQRVRAHVEVIASSPLSRCLDPARDWAREAGVPIVVTPDLREMAYGAWENLTHEEIEARFPGWLARWRKHPVGMRIPGAETVEAFARRVTETWHRLLVEHAGRHLLLVTHSGVMRVILAHALGAPLPAIRRFDVPYAAWARLHHGGHGACLQWLCGNLPQPAEAHVRPAQNIR